MYDVLANGAFMKKDFVNAEKLFVTVMQRLMSKGGRENDLNILHISLKLAKIYEAQKNFRCILKTFLTFHLNIYGMIQVLFLKLLNLVKNVIIYIFARANT